MEITETDNTSFISDGSATHSFGVGWQLLKTAFWPFLAIILIYTVIDMIPELFEGDDDSSLISTLLQIFISGPIAMSTAWVFLKAARRESYAIGDMFSVFKRNYWSAVGGLVLKALIIIAGLLLLIVPGIIFAIRLSFVEFLIIDRKMGPVEAISKSWKLTRGHGMTLFSMVLLSILVVLLGLLCLLVGVFVSIAWLYAASAVIYLTIISNQPLDSRTGP
jgi:uncharacterized membrane protein